MAETSGLFQHGVPAPKSGPLPGPYDQQDARIDAPIGASFTRRAAPLQTCAGRIEQLSKQLAEAAQGLEEARAVFRSAVSAKEQHESRFADLATQLMQAIVEHREDTPEGVPYPRP